jgi:hypothetical protein
LLSMALSPFDAANIQHFFYSANFLRKKMQFSAIFLKKSQIRRHLFGWADYFV